MPIQELTFQRVRVQPDDVIVVSCQDRLSPEHRQLIEETVQQNFFPNNKVMILDGGVTIAAMKPPEDASE